MPALTQQEDKCIRCGRCCMYVSCGLAEEYGYVQRNPELVNTCPALRCTGRLEVLPDGTRVSRHLWGCGLLEDLHGNDRRRVRRLLRVGQGCAFGTPPG
jgi:hypothetical protein